MGKLMNKFIITLKDPDGFYDGVEDAICLSTDDDNDWARADERSRINNAINKWVKYNEFIRIEFDLDKGTAIVLEEE